MVEFDIARGLKQFERGLDNMARRQLPFATALAATALARQAVADEQENERKVLDRPRPFTENAIRVIPARKDRPAVVYMQDITARYLRPYEFGGSNVLNSKVLLKPVQAMKDLDQYGNLPRRYLRQMKGRADVFVGTVKTKRGPITGLWQRTTDEGARVKVTRVGKNGVVRVSKTAKALNTSGALKLLVAFDQAHPVRQHLDWFGVAERSINKHFGAAMSQALAKALATAR